MGKRGKPPTPTAILKLRGSWRGNRNPDEPQPDNQTPTCPDWLDDYAKAAWFQIVPRLAGMGIIDSVDEHALVVLCQTWARWKRAEETLMKVGTTYVSKKPDGSVMIRKMPQVGIADGAAHSLARWFQEFGMSPSARSRIRVPDKKESAPDDLARYFGNAG